MIKNLEHTGTPFDYGNWRDSNLMDEIPSVGVDNNPDKNQMYVDKDRTFEDD